MKNAEKTNLKTNSQDILNNPNKSGRSSVRKGSKNPTPNRSGINNMKINKVGKEAPIVEEEVKPPPVKEKVIERFIYVTTYNDYEAMKIIKELFEQINRNAFDFKSQKEVYTALLTPEQQDDNSIDYISGFQVLDANLRITIIEGLSQKSMKLVKERLPKLEINNETKKIFCNSKILFDTRSYSKFNLALKFVKLRNPIKEILTTYDIYSKAVKYKDIYEAFMNLGGILKSDTLESICINKLFPTYESLIQLERKYGDILIEEDLTGIRTTKSKSRKKRLRADTMMINVKVDEELHPRSASQKKVNLNKEKLARINQKAQMDGLLGTISTRKVSPDKIKPKLDTRNDDFIHSLNNRMKVIDFHQRNIETIKEKSLKLPRVEKFCGHGIGGNQSIQPVYLYSIQRRNYYAQYFHEERNKMKNDKHNHYTYSKDHLSQSLQLNEYTNKNYEDYVENKSKWIVKGDFERYKQPGKEFIFIPKIHNEL